jgi:hypothetical protein
MRHRRGFSLIGTVVSITAMTLLLAMLLDCISHAGELEPQICGGLFNQSYMEQAAPYEKPFTSMCDAIDDALHQVVFSDRQGY